MSHYESIFRHRQMLDLARQPEWADDLASLNSVLSDLDLKHPYSLDRNPLARILQIPALKKIAAGLAATTNGFDYLFRIAPIQYIVADLGLQWKNKLISVADNRQTVNAFIADKERHGTDWLSLKQYARGELLGFRSCTWWTPLEITPETIVRSAHILGIPNDYVAANVLLLRLRLATHPAGEIHVPTALDGFLSLIFEASSTGSTPQTGTTIDISNPLEPKVGTQEVIIAGVPAEAIEFQPIVVDTATMDADPVWLDGPLLQAIEIFFHQLRTA